MKSTRSYFHSSVVIVLSYNAVIAVCGCGEGESKKISKPVAVDSEDSASVKSQGATANNSGGSSEGGIDQKVLVEIQKLGGLVDVSSEKGMVILFAGVHSKITDEGLEHLKDLTDLRELGLFYTQVTDAGLEHLKELTNLRELNLFDTKVTDAGLEQLSGLTNLAKLNLNFTKVTDEGVGKLQQALPRCEIRH